MLPLNQALAAASAALQRGDIAAARVALASHTHPKALHLSAIVENAAGNHANALSLLEKAANSDPNDPEIANHQGLFSRAGGDSSAAEAAFRRALALKPDFLHAGAQLGSLLSEQERWDDAREHYSKLLKRIPGDPSLRHGLAMAWLNEGRADDAEREFDTLIREGVDRPPVRFMRGRARLEQGRTEEALEDLRRAHGGEPSDTTLKALAAAVYMSGDEAGFRTLIDESAGNPLLVTTAAELKRQSGDPEGAASMLDVSRRQHHLPPESWIVSATALIDANRPEAAERAARACLDEAPGNRIILGSLISALLMQGKADEALSMARNMRVEEPDGQHWIAYEATALRLLGSDEYDSLVDLDRFVRPYSLPVPDGFDSIEDFNAAFLEALDRWHTYKLRPLDQSLRDGTQTPRDLTSIDDPVIQAFVQALDEPIRQYMSDVGTGAEHPLTARNSGDYRITGCWSVRLKGGGWHVNHVHPEGWISSAYYVTVPEETRGGEGKGGWIKFGEPPFETVPPSPPQKWVQPEAGLLVLFPSFLWHGTVPISASALRVTAPFDAVPA